MKYSAAAACLFFGAAAFARAQASGVPNFHEVNDHLYRGGQPTRQGFEKLAAMGVKIVIDLRETGEHSQAQEESWVTANRMRYLSLPLPKLSAPSDAQVSKILAILNNPSAGTVFVHCRRGADRTGTIIACYRIEYDKWDNRKALTEARRDGMSVFERGMQHYILHFNPEASAEAAPQ